MDDKSIVEVCVPVKFPKTEQAVLDAIAYREALEKAKYNAAPTLTVIKAALDARIEKAG